MIGCGLPLWIAPEIADALADSARVVALESTLVAQGLPWPDNLKTAIAAEQAVRAGGCVPATIAVVGGRVKVGLSGTELEDLARAGSYRKASRRDLAAAVARGQDAATTVSATLHIARLAGIGVMATGGLGGVHREAARSFDVSTDLDELGRAEGVLVVCSGFKSILDVPASVEALETRGVLALGYRAGVWPGFTSRETALPLEHRVETAGEAAAIVRRHRELKLPGAVVLAQPVPGDVALPAEMAEESLAVALGEASAAGVQGKAITPFLLGRMRELTGGLSLAANRALIVANAGLAGAVATALAEA